MAALIISMAALLVSALVALAVMELVADRSANPSALPGDTIEQFEVDDGVAGTLASSHGLPAAIDGTESHLALFISPMCTMCAGIAESFDGEIPDDVTVVVTASHPARQRQWASTHGLPADGVVFDEEMSIVNGLGVASSPTVIGFGAGRVVFAAGIGGRPALDKLLAQRAATVESIAEMVLGHSQSESDVPGSDGLGPAAPTPGSRAPRRGR